MMTAIKDAAFCLKCENEAYKKVTAFMKKAQAAEGLPAALTVASNALKCYQASLAALSKNKNTTATQQAAVAAIELIEYFEETLLKKNKP